jgi:hypothetical protein
MGDPARRGRERGLWAPFSEDARQDALAQSSKLKLRGGRAGGEKTVRPQAKETGDTKRADAKTSILVADRGTPNQRGVDESRNRAKARGILGDSPDVALGHREASTAAAAAATDTAPSAPAASTIVPRLILGAKPLAEATSASAGNKGALCVCIRTSYRMCITFYICLFWRADSISYVWITRRESLHYTGMYRCLHTHTHACRYAYMHTYTRTHTCVWRYTDEYLTLHA